MIEIKKMNIGSLVLNEGQIEGLPANPRQWSSEDVESLARSLIETPELFEARPIIAVKHGEQYIVLGGNMRTLAAENAGMSKVPVAVMPEDTPIDKMKEIVIKDNSSFGMWDTQELNEKWRDLPLGEWGVLLPEWAGEEDEEDFAGGLDHEGKETARLSELEYDPVYYEPQPKPSLTLQECLNLDKYNAKVAALEEYDLTEEQKKILRFFAFRFIKIDFEAVANYYAFNSSEAEKDAIERLRLVLVDGGGKDGLQGYIQDDMIKIADIAREAANEE